MNPFAALTPAGLRDIFIETFRERSDKGKFQTNS
jgi:hypothetical protein